MVSRRHVRLLSIGPKKGHNCKQSQDLDRDVFKLEHFHLA